VRTQWGTKAKTTVGHRRQLNIRIDARLYEALEGLARDEQRSVAQVAGRLVHDALHHRLDGRTTRDDAPAHDIGALADAGGAFSWLAAEPDLYDDTSGEPL
jgi:hypothetical protein